MKHRMLGIYLALISVSVIGADKRDLSPLFERYGISIKDQGGRGTCSVHALIGMIEFERAHKLKDPQLLSVEYLNWAANRVDCCDVDGTFFAPALEAILQFGVCRMDLMPYKHQFDAQNYPSGYALTDAATRKQGQAVWIKQWDVTTGVTELQMKAIKRAIDRKHPVAIGFRWPKGEVKDAISKEGMVRMITNQEVFDGHSVLIVGYCNDVSVEGGGYLIFKNSHGKGFGGGGYGKMPYSYVRAYANDAVWLKL